MTLAKSSLEIAARVPRARPGRARAGAFFGRIAAEHERDAAGRARDPRAGAPARAQPDPAPLDRHPQPLRRPDERDPGRAAAPLPRRRRERPPAARPRDRRASRPRCATPAERRRAAREAPAPGLPFAAPRDAQECADGATPQPASSPLRRAVRHPRRSPGEHEIVRARDRRELLRRLAAPASRRAAGTCSRSTATRGWSTSSATRRPATASPGSTRLEAELARAVRPGRQPAHPVLAPAGADACARSRSRASPFLALIEANRRDQRRRDYATYEELRRLLHLSANPVGELVLHVFGAGDPRAGRALRRRLHRAPARRALAGRRRGRRRRPRLPARRGSRPLRRRRAAISGPRSTRAPLAALLAFEVARARALLDEGAPAGRARCAARARLAVAGYVGGGRAALEAIEAAGYDVLAGAAPGGPAAPRAGNAARAYRSGRMSVAESQRAYEHCRELTRALAARASPPGSGCCRPSAATRSARSTRSPAGSTTSPTAISRRRRSSRALAATRRELARARAAGDPVLVALADAAAPLPDPARGLRRSDRRCRAGRARRAATRPSPSSSATARRVAGSIGRLALGVFDCSDRERGAALADDLGVALQIGNILRDVGEDAAAGRVYLPARGPRALRLRGRRRAASRARSSSCIAFEAEPRPRLAPARPRARPAARPAQRLLRARDGGQVPAAARADRARARRSSLRGRLSLRPWEKGLVLARSLAGAARGERSPRVAVVGGGLAGLAAAIECADGGRRGDALRGTLAARRRDVLLRAQRPLARQRPARRAALLHRLPRLPAPASASAQLLPLQRRLRVPVLREGRRPALLARSGAPGAAPSRPDAAALRAARPRASASRAVRGARALRQARPRRPGARRADLRRAGSQRTGSRANAVEALWNLIALPTLNLPAARGLARGRGQGVPHRRARLAPAASDIGVPRRLLPAAARRAGRGARSSAAGASDRLRHACAGVSERARATLDEGDRRGRRGHRRRARTRRRLRSLPAGAVDPRRSRRSARARS